ncbi:MAG: response regulator [Deltaproteobacteria bacterium]|nr:response regulator [Deltaproteobacteria bacterium]MDH3964655.1 response regulator [Deltaproteobacteria bacterium]
MQAFFQDAKWADIMLAKVLVVDDEKGVRDLLHRFLKATGYQAILASNGEEAIELAKSESPNAILLDFKMPGIDGVETCRRLRAEEQTRYIPVIMVTAFGTTETEATDAGADDLITKPFNLTDLAFRVKSLLRIGHLSDPVQRLMTYIDELDANRPD